MEKLKVKKSSKTAKKMVDTKKGAAEIDSLFSGISKRKKEGIEECKSSKKPKDKLKINAPEEVYKEEASSDHSYGLLKSATGFSIISPEAPLERIDKESGFPVYKAHLLKVGEGGGTDLCPFDCDCCF